jgi:hypothetical protein
LPCVSFRSLDDREDIAGVEDEDVLAFDGDFGAAVLRIDDGVALLDVDGNDVAGLFAATAGADGKNFTLLGLFFVREGPRCGLRGAEGS